MYIFVGIYMNVYIQIHVAAAERARVQYIHIYQPTRKLRRSMTGREHDGIAELDRRAEVLCTRARNQRLSMHRCQENMAHVSQARSDSGLDFQVPGLGFQFSGPGFQVSGQNPWPRIPTPETVDQGARRDRGAGQAGGGALHPRARTPRPRHGPEDRLDGPWA